MAAKLEELTTKLADGAGENLEYDTLYTRMDELAVPVPAQEIGENVVEGRDADYRELNKTCLALWGKTRDLRVAVYYTISSCCLDGLEGLSRGLKVIKYLIDELWDSFYPQLDPDDDNDPTERINILNMLSPPSGSYNDQIQFLARFRGLKLADGLPYTLRDVLIAQGILSSRDEPVDYSLLQAQMRGVSYEAINAKLNLTAEIQELLDGITETFNGHIGDSGYLNFEAFNKELKHLKKFYEQYAGTPAAPESVNESAAAPESQSAPVKAAPQAVQIPADSFDIKTYTVKNRADALMLIQKCAEYFKKAEPTSPLPYLLARSLRMAEMNFVDILAEIDQNALEKVKEQLGVLPTQDGN